MSSLSLAKLKALLPFSGTEEYQSHRNRTQKSTGLLSTLDPEVGFKMLLFPGQKQTEIDKYQRTVPELHVHIIGARHLPAMFGLKNVQGYVVKVYNK